MSLEALDAAATLPLAVLPPAFAAPASLATARFSDRGYMTRTTDTPANALYAARVEGDLEIGQAVFDRAAIGGTVGLAASGLDLKNFDRNLDDMIRLGSADGRPITIKVAPITSFAASDGGTAYAGASTVWSGRTAGWAARGLRARLVLADLTERLNGVLQANRFAGTGGIEGGPSLANLPKPIWLGDGNNANIRPVYLGEVDLGDGSKPTFMSNWREIAAHDVVRERGVVRTKVDTVPSAGEWRDWPLIGCFQTGFTPDGLGGGITCDLRGDAPLGAYVNTHAGIVKRLVTALGPAYAESEIDADAFAVAEFDLPGTVGWGAGAVDLATGAALEQILGSCVAFATGSRAGKLRLVALKEPSPFLSFRLGLPDIVAPVEELTLPAEIAPAPTTVEIRAAVNWTPLSDIASSVTGVEREQLAGLGPIASSFSNTIAGRVQIARAWRIPGLYREAGAAQMRGDQLRAWLERGLRLFRVVTDRYLGQMEIGYTGALTWPDLGLMDWPGVVVGWRERVGARRLELFLIG